MICASAFFTGWNEGGALVSVGVGIGFVIVFWWYVSLCMGCAEICFIWGFCIYKDAIFQVYECLFPPTVYNGRTNGTYENSKKDPTALHSDFYSCDSFIPFLYFWHNVLANISFSHLSSPAPEQWKHRIISCLSSLAVFSKVFLYFFLNQLLCHWRIKS